MIVMRAEHEPLQGDSRGWLMRAFKVTEDQHERKLDDLLAEFVRADEPSEGAAAYYDDEDYKHHSNIVMDWMLRIGVSVCFLATGTDRIVEPDVLNRDFQAYLDAVNRKDSARVAELQRLATNQRGEVGYAIGRRDALLGRRAWDVDTTVTHDGTGQPMRYRHHRNAHWQLYWTGAGRTVPVSRFKKMVVVRPDLPPDPRGPGYRTLRTRQEMENNSSCGSAD